MKTKLKFISLMAAASVLLSSCAAYAYPLYTGASVSVGGPGWSTSVSWSNASYDVNGFPIFGYYYGQPVYGYTAAGAAVFSFAALTAACLVPSWGPAPWYCGHWHYPPHIHRVACPPRYPAGHCPGVRPPHGGHYHPGTPHRPSVHRPSVHHHSAGAPGPAPHVHAAPKPVHHSKPAPVKNKPVVSRPHSAGKPQASAPSRPAHQSKPAPGNSRPGVSHARFGGQPRNAAPSRPSMGNRPAAASHSAPRGGSRSHGGPGGGRKR